MKTKPFCHYCLHQLQTKKGGGYYYSVMLTPIDGWPVKVHMGCVDKALKEGYMMPTDAQQEKEMGRINKQYRIPTDTKPV